MSSTLLFRSIVTFLCFFFSFYILLSIAAVLEEARFFQLTPLVEVLEEKVQEEIMRSQISFTRREFIQKMLLSSHTATLRCQGLVLIGIDFSRLDLRNCNFAFTYVIN